jgi:hypothetical protein
MMTGTITPIEFDALAAQEANRLSQLCSDARCEAMEMMSRDNPCLATLVQLKIVIQEAVKQASRPLTSRNCARLPALLARIAAALGVEYSIDDIVADEPIFVQR